MKKLIGSFLLATPLAIAGCLSRQGDPSGDYIPADQRAGSPAVRPDKPPPKLFSRSMLSKEQLALCSVFRAKDGSLRKAEFDALLNSGALPMNEFRMSRADIVDLLGGSPGGEQEDLKYDLGWEGQSRYNCTFRFRNRFAAGLYQERDF